MATKATPPPTYAEMFVYDSVTQGVAFNPIWLKWFVDLAAVLTSLTGIVTTSGTINVFDATHVGLVPASGGGTTNFLRADGTFAAGTAGPPGVAGPPGQLGMTGAMGGFANDGDDGIDAWSIPGQTGPMGPLNTTVILLDGQDGEDGMLVRGATGATGVVGPTGPVFSIDGEDGADGMAIPGNQGTTGPQGLSGFQGTPGVAVLALDGQDGEDGVQGIQGVQGNPGSQGIPGLTGFTGRDSPLMIDGQDGEDGMLIRGPQGIQGVTGAQASTTYMMPLDGQDGDEGMLVYTPPSPFRTRFTSANQTWTASVAITINLPWNTQSSLVTAKVICTTGDAATSYVPGDIVHVNLNGWPSSAGVFNGFSTRVALGSVVIAFCSATTFALVPKGGGAVVQVTALSNWALIIDAFI